MHEPIPYLPRIAKGAMINFSGAVVRITISYAYTLMLARLMDVDDLGIFYLMFTVITILGTASTAGLEFGVVRYVSLYSGEGRIGMARRSLRFGLLLGASVAVVVAAILVLLAPKVADAFIGGAETAVTGLRIFALVIPFMVVALLFNAATQGMHKMQYQVYSRDFGELSTRMALSAIILMVGGGLIGVVWANVASVVIAATLSGTFALILLSAGKRTDEPGSPAREIFRYSLPLSVSNVFRIMLQWIDLLLLGYLATTADVGYYSAALRVGAASLAVLMAFNTVFTPVISDLYNRGRVGELQKLLQAVTRWVFIFTYPIFLILLLFAVPVMRLYGPDFTVASTALILLALGQLVSAGTGPVGQIVLMSGHSCVALINTSIALAISVSLCFIMIPRYGIVGAALAQLASLSITNVLRSLEVWYFIRIQAYNRHYIKPISVGVAAAATVLLLQNFVFKGEEGLQSLLMAIVMLAFYLSVILIFGLDETDRELLRMIKAKLTGKTAVV